MDKEDDRISTRVLIVDRSRDVAERIAKQLLERHVAESLHAFNAEEAIRHSKRVAPALAIIADHLPGANGLTLVEHFRQQHKDVPCILMSETRSEETVIAAFERGVSAYVPRAQGFEAVVATRAAALMGKAVRLSYAQAMRLIGRQADLDSTSALAILEVDGGFLVRAWTPLVKDPITSEIPLAMLDVMMSRAIEARGEKKRPKRVSRLTPLGNAEALRVIGEELDRVHADAVSVTELMDFFAVSGVSPAAGGADYMMAPFQTLYRVDRLEQMIDDGREKRRR